ncbi:hypothetical protein ACAF76_014490 [Brevibacillus sp. TJ4]|uniref:hypothetical protein n=1 Tax=Brevibacillus sp. TJ4 TaxID=3234853 RepID=UPI003BA0799E
MRQSNKQTFSQRASNSLVPADFRDFLEKEAQRQDAELSGDFSIVVRDVQASPRSRQP